MNDRRKPEKKSNSGLTEVWQRGVGDQGRSTIWLKMWLSKGSNGGGKETALWVTKEGFKRTYKTGEEGGWHEAEESLGCKIIYYQIFYF